METENTQEVQNQITEEEQQPVNFGRFSIFLLIKTAQNNYGIKNSDYERYRRYCSRKIDKLRSSLNYKYGTKNKYVRKSITDDLQNEVKILQIALFHSEKYWAEANETKFSPRRNHSQKSRARFVSVKKLKRAVEWSAKLSQICEKKCELVSLFEAQSYQFYLQGMLNFEQQDWNQAQTRLIASREIMEDLIKSSDSLSEKIFRERIDQLDQTIKFCNFKISKGKDIPISQIIEMKKVGDANLSNLIENLAQQRLNEISLQETTNNQEVKFGAERYPVKQEKIVLQKSKIDSEWASLQEIKNNLIQKESKSEMKDQNESEQNAQKDEKLYEELLSLYSNLVVLIEDAIKFTDQEREDGKKNEKYTQGQLEILKKISSHFQQIKVTIFIDRGFTIFIRSSRHEKHSKKSSPQTLAKLLTATTNHFLHLIEITKERGEISTLKLATELEYLQERIFYLRTLRLYYVGQVYFNNDKIKEAYGLWNECSKCLNTLESKDEIKSDQQKSSFSKLLMGGSVGTELLVELGEIAGWLKEAKLKCVIQGFYQENKGKTEINQMMQEAQISEEQKNKDSNNKVTLEQLLSTKGSGTEINLEALSEIQILDLPGSLMPMPTRPIFFDIYQTTITYPEIEGKLKDKKSGGKWSIWGMFGK